MSFQGNVSGHVFQKEAYGDPLFLWVFLFLIIRGFCLQEIRKIKS